MLPTPQISVWSSRARLSSVRRRRSARDERVVVEARVQRVAGDVRDRGGTAVRRRSPDRVDGQAAEGALVDEAQLGAAVGEA